MRGARPMRDIKTVKDADKYVGELQQYRRKLRRVIRETKAEIAELDRRKESHENSIRVFEWKIGEIDEKLKDWKPSINDHKSERNQWIIEKRKSGATYASIAGKLGISISRARQVYERYARRKIA